jgi:hypothetical protein
MKLRQINEGPRVHTDWLPRNKIKIIPIKDELNYEMIQCHSHQEPASTDLRHISIN